MLKKEKSQALSDKFNQYYPGGHSNLRIPMDVTNHRLFIEKSVGTHLTDVDGNEYIEYNGSMGPNILGHAYPEFVEKLTAYMMDHGTAIGSNLLFSPYDISVAEKLCKYEMLGDASRINTENDEYQAVTVEQFNQVARKIFRPENCSTLYYGPRW